METTSWIQLVVICFFGAMSPGPSLALVVNNTLSRGRAYGMLTSLGHAVGIGCWAFLTAAGISEILVDQSILLLVLQSFGACLFFYIGIRTITTSGALDIQQTVAQPAQPKIVIAGISQGFLVSLSNPKIALFFLAIFSHLVESNLNWLTSLVMSITATSIDALWYIFVAVIITTTKLQTILQDRQLIIRWVSGIVLIVISIYLLGMMFQRLWYD